MNALQQLTAIAGIEPEPNLAGTCGNCGRNLYRQRTPPHQRPPGSVERAGPSACRACHQSKLRKTGPMSRRHNHSGVCIGCRKVLRYKGEPVAVGERRRHAKDRCSTCYRKNMAAEVIGRNEFLNCTVCLREFGSRGIYGGTVSLGTKSTGVCTTCRDRNVQRRRRGEQENGAG